MNEAGAGRPNKTGSDKTGSNKADLDAQIKLAVERSHKIDDIIVSNGALKQAPELLQKHFPGQSMLIVGDQNTMAAAGNELMAMLSAVGIDVDSFIFSDTGKLTPSITNSNLVLDVILERPMVPIVVGSGVLNDLVKHAAFKAGRPYICVATAVSMDGYAGAGAPLSDQGFKHTIQCEPPRLIIADLDVLCAAPPPMAGWGYGDLAGKMPAGADWILADAVGVEAINGPVWSIVQDNLRTWLGQPDAIRRADSEAIAALFAGLTIAGIAMELHNSSRPASGSDHQIAHIWEMEHLQHDGHPVSHGGCVAIGTLSVMTLYSWLLGHDEMPIDVKKLVSNRASLDTEFAAIDSFFGTGVIAEKSKAETSAKYPDEETLHARLTLISNAWPQIRQRLQTHLIGAGEMRDMLARGGVPTKAKDIGVDQPRYKRTVLAARYIRRRYTILDFLSETGLLEKAVDDIFAAGLD